VFREVPTFSQEVKAIFVLEITYQKKIFVLEIPATIQCLASHLVV
jgi:hypothetical protein